MQLHWSCGFSLRVPRDCWKLWDSSTLQWRDRFVPLLEFACSEGRFETLGLEFVALPVVRGSQFRLS